MNQKNYYEILGIDKNASNDEIKRVYKKLALQYFYVTKDEKGRYVTGSCYVEENYPLLKPVFELIREAGGVCILADTCSI